MIPSENAPATPAILVTSLPNAPSLAFFRVLGGTLGHVNRTGELKRGKLAVEQFASHGPARVACAVWFVACNRRLMHGERANRGNAEEGATAHDKIRRMRHKNECDNFRIW